VQHLAVEQHAQSVLERQIVGVDTLIGIVSLNPERELQVTVAESVVQAA